LARRVADADVVAAYRRLDPSADAGQLEHVSTAVHQWCRLIRRHPGAHLAVPSSAVAGVWNAMGGRPTDPDAGVPLETTYLLSCADEGAAPPHLPLLFRVDWLLDRLDGRTYAPNCGEVRYCAAADGTVCLQHVAHRPRRKLVWRAPMAGIPLGEVEPHLRAHRRR
jgi:hypothetical protein